MIKLKSLFRRGQGPSGSSKHSTNSSNPLRSAASASSLNSIGLSTTSSSTTTTTKSSKSTSVSALKKGGSHTGSNDHFETSSASTFLRGSRESLDIKDAKLLTIGSAGSAGTDISGGGSSIDKIKIPNSQKRLRNEREQLHLQLKSSMQMPDHLTGKSNSGCVSGSGHLLVDQKDSDNENYSGIGSSGAVVVGLCADGSCYSNSMRDLLSDDLTDDGTFDATEDFHVSSLFSRF